MISPHPISELPATQALERRAARVAVVVGITLMAIKFTAYVLTSSAAIFSDAAESIVNVVASIVALYALSLAHRPADAEHPYGHGKAEFVSAAIEGGLILAAAGATLIKAAQSAIDPELHPGSISIGAALIAVTIAANGLVGWWLIRLARRTGSMTLDADGRHLLSDAWTSAAAIGALLAVAITGITLIDPLVALVMAALLARVGFSLVRRSLAGLMDELDLDDDRRLAAILDAHLVSAASHTDPPICSYHKLRHRHVGRHHWVDFHIRVDPAMSVESAHVVASAIEREVESALGHADATAHVEPCSRPACPHR